MPKAPRWPFTLRCTTRLRPDDLSEYIYASGQPQSEEESRLCANVYKEIFNCKVGGPYPYYSKTWDIHTEYWVCCCQENKHGVEIKQPGDHNKQFKGHNVLAVYTTLDPVIEILEKNGIHGFRFLREWGILPDLATEFLELVLAVWRQHHENC